MTFFPRISGPIAPYSNLPIEPQNFQPSQFNITGITLGSTTTVTMANGTNNVAPNYVVGQQVKLLIPVLYGAFQLNNQFGFVLSVPSASSVEIGINSVGANAFISNPLTAAITGATNANPCVLTSANSFLTGNTVTITGISGMTELNGLMFRITRATATSLTLNVDSTFFGVYSGGGLATLFTNQNSLPQIIAIGDQSSGQINSSGRVNQGTFIPGSFQNISPA